LYIYFESFVRPAVLYKDFDQTISKFTGNLSLNMTLLNSLYKCCVILTRSFLKFDIDFESIIDINIMVKKLDFEILLRLNYNII